MRNLEDAFDLVGDQPVFRTLSANIVVVLNELRRMAVTPAIEQIANYLKAATIQVNDHHNDPISTYSTTTGRSRNRRSRHYQSPPRPHQHGGNIPPDNQGGRDGHQGSDNRNRGGRCDYRQPD